MKKKSRINDKIKKNDAVQVKVNVKMTVGNRKVRAAKKRNERNGIKRKRKKRMARKRIERKKVKRKGMKSKEELSIERKYKTGRNELEEMEGKRIEGKGWIEVKGREGKEKVGRK